MKIFKINEKRIPPGILFQTSQLLRSGGAVIFPTDTLYALGVDATNKAALRLLFKIKNRPSTKPIPIFVKDLDMLRRYAYIEYGKEKILEKLWPGAVTVVLNKRPSLPQELTGEYNTVGVRIPAHEVPMRLVKSLGLPITATSANISGEGHSARIRDIIGQFGKQDIRPNIVLDAGDIPESKPSTVLDFTHEEPEILRAGPVTNDQLKKIFGVKSID